VQVRRHLQLEVAGGSGFGALPTDSGHILEDIDIATSAPATVIMIAGRSLALSHRCSDLSISTQRKSVITTNGNPDRDTLLQLQQPPPQ
jgi:hypothetical protein